MGIVKFFRRLNPIRNDGYLDRRKNEEVIESTDLAAKTLLLRIDRDLPDISAFLQGQPVRTKIRFEGEVTLQLDSSVVEDE